MIKRNTLLRKICLLGLLTLIGIGAISATKDNNSEIRSPYFLTRTFASNSDDSSYRDLESEMSLESSEDDAESQELENQEMDKNLEEMESEELPDTDLIEDDDPLLTTLFDEVLSEIDDDDFDFEDWETALLDDEIEWADEPSPSSLLGGQAQVITYRVNDLDLLPLNELVYEAVNSPSSWTREVKVATSQVNTSKPIVIGSRSYENVLQEQKPSGIRIYTEHPTLEGGGAAVADSQAALKEQENLEFGLPPQPEEQSIEPESVDLGPFAAEDLDAEARSSIFIPIEPKLASEPFRVAQDDEMEPFDHAVYEVNAFVFDKKTQKAKEQELLLVAQATPPAPVEEKTPVQEESPPPDQEWERKAQPEPQEEAKEKTEAEQPQSVKVDEQKPAEPQEEVIEEPPEEPEGPPRYLIKFNNVKMSEYIGFVSKITSKNFIFDPADLNFNVTIVSNEPTTIENIISALLQELRFRGLSMVEVGNNIIIHQQLGINSPAQVVPEGETPPPELEIVTQVYRIQNTDPSTIATIIRPMMSLNALIEPITESGHLIVTGLRTNINRITDLINNIDSPSDGLEIGEYQFQNLPVSRAIQIARELIAPIAKDRAVVLTPLTNKNVVYVVTTPSLLAQVLKIFQKIDKNEELPSTRFDKDDQGRPIVREEFLDKEDLERQKEEEKARAQRAAKRAQTGPLGSVEATKFYIHKLQYRKGEQIQQALQAVATSLQDVAATAEAEDTELISTINSVQWIESTNSLIFTGTQATLEKMKELIDELDTALPQVLIEILVLEATIDDSLSFGVDWGTRFRELHAAGSQAFIGQESTLPAALDSSIPTSTLNANNLARTAGFNIGVIGRIITRGACDFTSMGAVVRALHTDRRIDVLLNPRIVVEDNAVAEFFVGINTPYLTQSIANEFGNVITGNFEYRDVGSTIKITPLIGNNGIITMDIEQEISSPVATNELLLGSTTGTATTVTAEGAVVPLDETGGGGGSSGIGPTTRKSTTKTRIHMPDGYFLILSGQIRDEKEVIRTQIPCIGGIPWLGAFFSAQDTRIDKKNLMIFIRPQIVDIERINLVTKRQQDQWTEAKREHKRWQYEVDEALEWFNVKDPYCAPEERRIRE